METKVKDFQISVLLFYDLYVPDAEIKKILKENKHLKNCDTVEREMFCEYLSLKYINESWPNGEVSDEESNLFFKTFKQAAEINGCICKWK